VKILHLICSNGLYGAENVLLNLGRSLKKEGHRSYVVCLKDLSRAEPEIYLESQKQELPGKVVNCRRRFDLKVPGELKNFINQEKIDLIHSHGYKSNFYGLMTAKMSKVPILATVHGWTGETDKLRLYENLDKWVVKMMDHLIAVSPMICNELRSLGLNTARVTFIPNGIDVERFDPKKVNADVRKEFGIEDSFVIGSVGRISNEKGHIYLIKAFEKIQSKIPGARLMIIGDGPLLGELKEYARKHLIANKVIFTGIREDLPSLYRAMDVFVLPSLKEGIPMALLEAMAMEIPVIATDVGGIPYVVSPDQDGILIPPVDPDILAEKISSFLQDEPLRFEIGKKARSKIIERFSLNPLYQSYLKVYQNVKRINS